jgi:hypothetical protein
VSRILQGTTGTLEVTLYADGAPVDPEASPAPQCTVRDALGETLATGAATIVGSGSGKLRFALAPAVTAAVNRLVVEWSNVKLGTDDSISVITTAEVVGELLFTEAAARAFDGGQVSNATNYPSTTILEARDRIHDAFERIIGVGLGTRYHREVMDGPGTAAILLERTQVTALRSVSIRTPGTNTWTAYTSDELAGVLVYRRGRLERESGVFTAGRGNLRVAYEHGITPIPEDIRRAALWVMRYELVPSNMPARATHMVSEAGQFSLATAGRGNSWYGIPDADAVLNDYRSKYRVPAV